MEYDGCTILNEIAHDGTKAKLTEVYDKWSKSYDTHVARIGYCAPIKTAELFSAKLKELGFPLDARILDLGSGTGMAGEALHKLGHSNMDALDMSAQSLEVAKSKGVYKNVMHGYMGSEDSRELGVSAADQYDAAICVGCFTTGHVKKEGFDDFVRVVKPGGLVCFTMREHVYDDPRYEFKEKMETLAKDNKWKLIERVREQYYDNMWAWVYFFQVI